MQIYLHQGDITSMDVDSIVNAANSGLRGGGGVDGAIHRAGGHSIMADCKQIGGCPTGKAVITTGGNLLARKVIHTVGPVWSGGHNGESDLLASAYQSSLQLAFEHDLKSIAFPNISTGIYGYPKDLAAEVAVKTVRAFANALPDTVYFVCFDEENYRIYERLLGGHPSTGSG